MKIQPRILVLLASVLIVSLVIMSAVMLAVVTPAFERLDRDQAIKNVKRVEQSIANELEGLDETVADWANWNESYVFALDRSEEYITANLQASSLLNLGVTFMGFFDNMGEVAWVGSYDPVTKEALTIPGLSEPAQMAPVLAAANATPVHGLLAIDSRYFFISASDILDNDGNGPSHGTLIMGREIDDALLQDLQQRTEVVFRMQPRQSEPGDGEAAPSGPTQIAQGDDFLRHRITLKDVGGIDRLDLDIETPRDASAVGRNSVLIATVLLIVTALLTMVVIAVAVNGLIVRPIRQINLAMRDVGESADLEKRLRWTRRDELGILARQFDHMLEQIADARRDLLELTFKIGRSDLAVGMFHNLRNAMSPLANQLHRALESLTPTGGEQVKRALTELKDVATDAGRKARLLDFLAAAWSQDETSRQAAGREIDAATGQLVAIEKLLNRQHDSQDAAVSTEALSLPFLVNESLAFFGTGQLAIANIEIDASLGVMPLVAVQRLPMIHVLYNVIANAITAIQNKGDKPGHVVMKAASDPQKGVVLMEIVDNGIGVDVTMLNDIFRSGYTTKRDKKGGEGLHWCANTMAACGGRIWAKSAGIGDGMTIFIEIPQASHVT